MKRPTETRHDSVQTFRDHVLKLMRRSYPELPAKLGPDDASISIEPTTVNLGNIYSRIQLLPAKDRDAAVLEFLSMAVESHQQSRAGGDLTWSKAKSLLRARLVASQVFDPAADVANRPFAPGVVIAYAIDHGRIVSFVRQSDLKRWRVELSRAHETAIANLEDLSEGVEIEVLPGLGGGAFAAIEANDSYDAARLALPRFRARLLAALGVPAFVGIPNRDFLVAWSADSGQFAGHVAQVVEDFRRQPYPITDAIFRIDHSGVRPSTASERGGLMR